MQRTYCPPRPRYYVTGDITDYMFTSRNAALAQAEWLNWFFAYSENERPYVIAVLNSGKRVRIGGAK